MNIVVWSPTSTTTNKPKISLTPNLKVTQKPEHRIWPDLIRTISIPESDYTDSEISREPNYTYSDIPKEPDDTDSETSPRPDYHDSILITPTYDRSKRTHSPEYSYLS